MKSACPAKINLFLKVTGKRADGFHELESLFAFIDLVDELEVEVRNTTTSLHGHPELVSGSPLIEITGKFSHFLDPKNNLFTKILDFFAENFGVTKNLHIKIKKNIPIGAGLGGGSSDAAFFMKALNKIFALNLSKEKLQEISLNFGSDIAFFFEDQASIVKGRGEIIENFPAFKTLPALLINPGIFLSTKEVFGKFNGNFSQKILTEELLKKDVLELIGLPNDLEKAAISMVPEISKILNELKNSGAEISKMSGSGTTCFGIFADEKKLDEAEKKLAEKFPEFFVKKINILSHNKKL